LVFRTRILQIIPDPTGSGSNTLARTKEKKDKHLDLQLVLVVGVAVGEVPELLGLVEAPLQVLRRHEVLRHFDTVVDVPHL